MAHRARRAASEEIIEAMGSASTSGAAAGVGVIAMLREGGRPLAALLALAALLHIAYAIDFHSHHPLAATPIADAQFYFDWARAIAAGDWAGPAEPFHHPPLYPYVLGVLFTLTGPSLPAVTALQVLLGLLTLALTYALTRRVAERNAALIACALIVFYLPLPLLETRLLPAVLATTLATAALWLATSPRLDPATLLCCGMLFGLASAARPNQLLATGLIVIALGWRLTREHAATTALRAVLLVSLGAGAAIAPFFLHNLLHGGEPVLLCDTGGINLYFAHHADSGASFRTRNLAFGEVADQALTAKRLAEQAEGRTLTFAEVSSHFARRAFDHALEHPLQEARLLIARLHAFVANFEYCIIYCPEAERGLLATSRVLVLPAGLLIALALAGLSLPGGRARAAALLPVIAFLLGQLATVLLFFQYSRFRLVAIPAFAMLAGLCLDQAPTLWRSARRSLLPALAIGVAVLIAACLPPGEEAREQRAIGRITLAEGLIGRGDLGAAEQQIDLALNDAPQLIRARLARFTILRAARRPEDARAALEALLDHDDGHPLVLATLARFLVEESAVRDLARAATLAERATAAAPALPEPRIALAMARLLRKDPAAAYQALRPILDIASTPGEAYLLAGTACQQQGQPAEAEALLLQAMQRSPDDPRALATLIVLYDGLGRNTDARARRAELRRLAPDHPLVK